jgi:hypothetical protein
LPFVYFVIWLPINFDFSLPRSSLVSFGAVPGQKSNVRQILLPSVQKSISLDPAALARVNMLNLMKFLAWRLLGVISIIKIHVSVFVKFFILAQIFDLLWSQAVIKSKHIWLEVGSIFDILYARGHVAIDALLGKILIDQIVTSFVFAKECFSQLGLLA